MFYWIKNWKLFLISEEKSNIKVDEWLESEIENWVYENWEIVPKEESEQYQQYLEELAKKQLEEKIKELQEQGYNVDDEWNIIKDEKWLEVETQKINKWFDETIVEYIKDYPEQERATWPIQLAEAEKVLNWETSVYIDSLAQAKWIDTQTLAETIKTKSEEYNTLYANLVAEKENKLKELEED